MGKHAATRQFVTLTEHDSLMKTFECIRLFGQLPFFLTNGQITLMLRASYKMLINR